MPGFLLAKNISVPPLINYDDSRCCRDFISDGSSHLCRCTLNKFREDKLFFRDEEFTVVLEGVIYNKAALTAQYGGDWKHSFKALLREHGEHFVQRLDGPVSGAVYFAREDRWQVFTSRLGEKAVFYYFQNGRFVCGSQLNYISDTLRQNGIARLPDEKALRQFLGYGCYADESTCIQSVHRLYPGSYLCLEQNGSALRLESYGLCDPEDCPRDSEEDYISALDGAFRRAMEKILRKNDEYGYKTVLDCSGGLDSRMICYAAKALGAENALMISYGQSGCADLRIAKRISRELGYPLITLTLDNADCMMHIDDNIFMNNGAASYYHITGGTAMLASLPEDCGLECTGLLGDVSEGAMYAGSMEDEIDRYFPRFRNSNLLTPELDFAFPEALAGRFAHQVCDRFWLYTRGCMFGMSSFFLRQNFTEAAAPFGDTEFLRTYLSVPWRYRTQNPLLRRWMVSRYPAAGRIPYGESILPLRFSCGVHRTAAALAERIENRLRRELYALRPDRPRGMNDLACWYKTIPAFSGYIRDYYSQSSPCLSPWPEIAQLARRFYESENITDKLMAVSLVAMVKRYIA